MTNQRKQFSIIKPAFRKVIVPDVSVLSWNLNCKNHFLEQESKTLKFVSEDDLPANILY